MARIGQRAGRREPAWADPVRVKEWMATPAVTIASAATVREAIEVMKARGIRHLPVTGEDGRLAGIVTDRDLRQMIFDPSIEARLDEAAELVKSRTVREVMTWGVVAVRPDAGVRQAARLMYEQKIGALPVVDHGRVVGILTERDVLRAFESLVRERTATVRPIAEAQSDGDFYDYGFPEPSWGEPWEELGGGQGNTG
jgi:CBS domain-containing protein